MSSTAYCSGHPSSWYDERQHPTFCLGGVFAIPSMILPLTYCIIFLIYAFSSRRYTHRDLPNADIAHSNDSKQHHYHSGSQREAYVRAAFREILRIVAFFSPFLAAFFISNYLTTCIGWRALLGQPVTPPSFTGAAFLGGMVFAGLWCARSAPAVFRQDHRRANKDAWATLRDEYTAGLSAGDSQAYHIITDRRTTAINFAAEAKILSSTNCRTTAPKKAATGRPRDPSAITASASSAAKKSTTIIKNEPFAPEEDSNANVYDDDADSDDEDFVDWDGFEVSRALPRFDERRYTLRELMMLLDTPDGIDLEPVYQRGFVWNEDRQIGLVDSIFQGYYIPGLIFNKQRRQIGGIQKDIMVCIDGKQRLTSVKRFTEGHSPCHDGYGNKWYFCRPLDAEKQPHGRRYLPAKAKAAFWQKTFLCYEYVGMTDDQEHELFERVQRGNPLTPAEKSQAKKGPWQELARQFEQDFLRVMKLGGNARGAGHSKIISSFVQILERDRAATDPLRPEQFRGTNYWIHRWFVQDMHQHPCTPELQDRMKRVFDRFEQVARSKRAFLNDGLPNERATLAPIEFVAIACMIDKYPHKTNSEFEDTLRFMRREVRKIHNNDVQRKPAVWRTLCAAIENSLEGTEKTQAGADVDEVDEDVIQYEVPVSTIPDRTASQEGGDYIRGGNDIDDEGGGLADKVLDYWHKFANNDSGVKKSPALKRSSKADEVGRNKRQRSS